MTAQQFFIGAAMFGIGVTMVMKTDAYYSFFGVNNWAEEKIGPGGSRFFYKIIGVFICFLGILGMTGLLSDFLGATVGAFFSVRPAK